MQIRVTASDAENVEENCELHLAWKTRPKLWPDSNSAKKSTYDGPLFRMVDAIAYVHNLIDRGTDIDQGLERAKTLFRNLHPGDRTFAEHALEQYFEYHESREQELGKMRFLTKWSVVPLSTRAHLAVWGPMYESANGDREIRRLRFKRAKREHTSWADIAAHVAAKTPGLYEVQRIHVVEVGLLDGVEHQILQGISVEDARNGYFATGKDAANRAALGTEATPGSNCSECKILSSCESVPTANGLLQLNQKGPWTRSVSARDLDTYEQCASRWHMISEHLPTEYSGSQAQTRGLAVHQWIRKAHERGIACTADDLQSIDDSGQGLSSGFTREEYALALPYLESHLYTCPLSDPEVHRITIEKNLYAYDSTSDVVVASKPDMLLSKSGRLIVHEVKTTEKQMPFDEDEARGNYLSVSMNLLLLQHTLIDQYEATSGEVHLEILTSTASEVFKYSTTDADLMTIARSRVRNISREWVNDTSWLTKPGPQCSWCPVRRWCPDRDNYASQQSAEVTQIDSIDDSDPF